VVYQYFVSYSTRTSIPMSSELVFAHRRCLLVQEAGIDTAPLSPSETSLPLAVAQIISTARQALASGVSASARA